VASVKVIGAVAAAVLAVPVWAVTGGYFWPRWVWFGLAVVFALRYGVQKARRVEPGRRRILAIHIAVYCVLIPSEIAIWALSGGGLFWPIFAILFFSIALGTHVWVLSRLPVNRERELSQRIDVLARTRRGALDAQAAELQRIERDLHDGAQARMVSLAMSLALAERLVRTDPDAAESLVAEARASTLQALEDLRTVMHTVHPPVLADRGLGGAVEALALDLAVPVTVRVDLPGPAPAAIESALYFAVAECLANVVKHSHASAAVVDIRAHGDRLVAVVRDDGIGGASLQAGTGLQGIARRLEAFDGVVGIRSPAGGPTTVTLEVPCEWSSPKTSRSSATA
jgi:signal transduction histidine kinase